MVCPLTDELVKDVANRNSFTAAQTLLSIAPRSDLIRPEVTILTFNKAWRPVLSYLMFTSGAVQGLVPLLQPSE